MIEHGIAHRSSGKEKENSTTGHMPVVQKAAHGDPDRTLNVVTEDGQVVSSSRLLDCAHLVEWSLHDMYYVYILMCILFH